MATETHYPHRNGPWCGRDRIQGQGRIPTPTDARDYSLEPTCESCAKLLAAVNRPRVNKNVEPLAKAKKAATPGDDE